jgi:hypothetical protein
VIVFSTKNTLKSKIEKTQPKEYWMKQKARDELMKKQTELILYGIWSSEGNRGCI